MKNIYKLTINELLKKDISFKSKLKEVSIFISTFTLHFEAFEREYHYPQYVDLRQINDSHYYKKPFFFVKDIINDLKDDSFLSEPLMLLNSNISTDINLNNYTVNLLKSELPDMVSKMSQKELSQMTSIEIFKKFPREVFEINIINLKIMKKEILDFIPTSFYRWYSEYYNRAMYQSRVDMMVINERHLFNKDKEDNDELYNTPEKIKDYSKYSVPVFFEILHEILAHKKVSILNYSKGTPSKYVKNGEMIQGEKDSGRIIESFISDEEHIEFIKMPLKYVSPFALINFPEYYTYNTNEGVDSMINILKKREMEEKKRKEYNNTNVKKDKYCNSFERTKRKYDIKSRLFRKLTIGLTCN